LPGPGRALAAFQAKGWTLEKPFGPGISLHAMMAPLLSATKIRAVREGKE
jgi:hypothetical protein